MTLGLLLPIVDNSGVKSLNCIRALKLSPRSSLSPGVTVVGSVRRMLVRRYRRVRVGTIQRALITQLGFYSNMRKGAFVRSSFTGGVLLARGTRIPIANRVPAPVFFELRFRGYFRIFLICRRVY
jgi:ribosomal protein L14